jgi:probable F420-dependent oxidoreductase
MHVGIISNCSDRSLDAATQARMAEEAGLESITFGEHSHVPAARETPYPGGDGTLPAGYERTLDLFVVLTWAALATSEIKIGSGICQVVQRDPIQTAKAVASVDHISNGRMLLVTGSSWNLQEMRNHGTDPETRYELLDERVLAMREIWTQDEATFHGRFVNFDRIWSWPKPAQRPHPPVLVGGLGRTVLDRVLAFGDGWLPFPYDGLLDRVADLRRRAAELGRDVTVVVAGAPTDPAVLEHYLEVGIDRVLFEIPAAGRGPVERALDTAEAAMAKAFGT